jgi:hypothetical protein
MTLKQKPAPLSYCAQRQDHCSGDFTFLSGRRRRRAIATATEPCRAQFEPEQLACFASGGQNSSDVIRAILGAPD